MRLWREWWRGVVGEVESVVKVVDWEDEWCLDMVYLNVLMSDRIIVRVQ